ncbi:hypothetical protein L7F22_027470 [Adiantum nelumboides]|nr:hypothetical protein [Adiantum nelumboides]
MTNPLSTFLPFVGEVILPTATKVGDPIPFDREWIIDRGAARHVSSSYLDLTDFSPRDGTVCIGDKSEIPICGEGIMNLIPDGKGGMHPSQVIYCPQLGFHLLSVHEVCKLGKEVIFDIDSVSIQDKETVQEVRGGDSTGGLYKLCALSAITCNAGALWHYRCGHLHADAFQHAFTQQLVDGMPDAQHPDGRCVPCIRGKQHREAFPKKASKRATRPLELVHTDLCGLMSVDSLGGSKHFMLIVDDYIRFMWVYFLTHKSEAISTFICWKAHVEKESGHQVKAVHSDHGSEFTSHQFVDYCARFGIRRELSNVGTPSKNGMVERKNWRIVEMGRTMLEHRDLPRYLWAESVATAVHILNRAPTSTVPQATLYEVYFGRKPSIAHLCIFGYDAYAHIPKKDRSKFDAKSLLDGAPGLSSEGASPHVSLVPDESDPLTALEIPVGSSDGISILAFQQLRSSPISVLEEFPPTEKNALEDEDNGPDELSTTNLGF